MNVLLFPLATVLDFDGLAEVARPVRKVSTESARLDTLT